MAEHARGGAEAAMFDHLAKQFPIAPIHVAIVHPHGQCVQTNPVLQQMPMT
jgi:hypothetical protein